MNTISTERGDCEVHTQEDFEISCRAVDSCKYEVLSGMRNAERKEGAQDKTVATIGFARTAVNMIKHAHVATYGVHALDSNAVY